MEPPSTTSSRTPVSDDNKGKNKAGDRLKLLNFEFWMSRPMLPQTDTRTHTCSLYSTDTCSSSKYISWQIFWVEPRGRHSPDTEAGSDFFALMASPGRVYNEVIYEWPPSRFASLDRVEPIYKENVISDDFMKTKHNGLSFGLHFNLLPIAIQSSWCVQKNDIISRYCWILN